MSNIGTLTILILLTTFTDLKAVTVVNHHPDDEYVLEHEVLYEDAINEAKKLEIFPGPIPGCKHCTNSEITYCKNGSVINDHCCCDGSYNKVFPFVEHSCRVGPEECKVEAGDCAEYTRLRECCCHSYLASVWKYLATGQGSRNYANLIMFLTILLLVLGLYL
ncbi:uncharacterized protein LOC122513280 isoform X1 [Polistes fuscatus]|uniref:uncharacterized protein LOC106792488 n=1 Tax=Polistes canadensis TaxID=91411 RepID=UPI000718CDF1|nr:PREDICTED: uncharacterized protein LOC106792488 [Polistes canadensis]XP_014614413.1 PREDICTED: uncharacterized protein LOC106792488 [Polistes canadensis]XP_043485493.1 uncharacterized protein LOC122513280 isoform X1 [Polistes fuscatus]KAI4477858.1 hypothetical protein M0804_012338 [Polistes exclamans]